MDFKTPRFIMNGVVGPIFYMIYEFFLLKYIFLLFGGLSDSYLLILTLIIGFLFISSTAVELKRSNIISRFFMEVSAIIQWASLMYLFDIIIIYLINWIIPLPHYLIVAILAIVPIIGVYSYYKAHNIVVKEHELKIANLKEDLNIVHLSDVHIGSIRNQKLLKKIANKLNNLEKESDFAIISGDLADGTCDIPIDTFMPLANVNIPIIFTPGNHDFYPGIDNVIAAAKKANIIVLDNDSMEFNGLNIFGLTFSFGNERIVSLDYLANSIKSDLANLIIYHAPVSENWELFKKLGFDIQLAGHTHGGQFYPANIWVSMVFPFCKGLFKEQKESNLEDNYLSVTNGVGTMGPPMRWGTEAELLVLKLRRK